jgi:putative transcriptional regulator
MKKPVNTTELKEQLRDDIIAQTISLGEATKRMRKIVGLNQKEYATRIVKISPRILAAIEKGAGNPTVETLNKIGKPFGYQVGFIHR